jgi:hypothetical protein
VIVSRCVKKRLLHSDARKESIRPEARSQQGGTDGLEAHREAARLAGCGVGPAQRVSPRAGEVTLLYGTKPPLT